MCGEGVQSGVGNLVFECNYVDGFESLHDFSWRCECVSGAVHIMVGPNQPVARRRKICRTLKSPIVFKTSKFSKVSKFSKNIENLEIP